MEGKAILKVLILAALLQASYATSFTLYTAYNDSSCTTPSGGVTILASNNACNPAACQIVSGGLYLATTCSAEDPVLNGLPDGAAVWYTYYSTDGTCSPTDAPYDTVRVGAPGGCFLDETLNVVSFGACVDGGQKFNTWTDYAGCLDGSSPTLSNTLADGTCLQTTGPDQKGMCPVVAQPMAAPMSEPMAEPMAAPMAASPVAQQPTAGSPVAANTPSQAPAVKKSGAVANAVSMVTLGMIVLSL